METLGPDVEIGLLRLFLCGKADTPAAFLLRLPLPEPFFQGLSTSQIGSKNVGHFSSQVDLILDGEVLQIDTSWARSMPEAKQRREHPGGLSLAQEGSMGRPEAPKKTKDFDFPDLINNFFHIPYTMIRNFFRYPMP